MMHGGMMFFPWMAPVAGPWLLLIPLAVFIAIGVLLGVAAYRRDSERRTRKARKIPLQDQILQLAFRKDGLLTVTDVVAQTGLSFQKAEKILKSMVDFSHVGMRVSDSGVIVYEFIEIRNKDQANAKTLRELGV